MCPRSGWNTPKFGYAMAAATSSANVATRTPRVTGRPRASQTNSPPSSSVRTRRRTAKAWYAVGALTSRARSPDVARQGVAGPASVHSLAQLQGQRARSRAGGAEVEALERIVDALRLVVGGHGDARAGLPQRLLDRHEGHPGIAAQAVHDGVVVGPDRRPERVREVDLIGREWLGVTHRRHRLGEDEVDPVVGEPRGIRDLLVSNVAAGRQWHLGQ